MNKVICEEKLHNNKYFDKDAKVISVEKEKILGKLNSCLQKPERLTFGLKKVMVVLGVLLTSKEWRVVGAAFSSTSKKERSFLSLLKQKLKDCLWSFRSEINGIRQGDGTWLNLG